jgi:fibronectin-binding autotransporter adhesin
MRKMPRMKQRRRFPFPLSTCIAAVCALGFAQKVDAAIDRWTGGVSVNWADLNWAGGNNPPLDGDLLEFDAAGATGANLNNNLTSFFNVAGITFTPFASAYIFSGNPITLFGPVANNSVNIQTINFGIELPALQTFTTSAVGSDITLGGVINGTGTISKLGAGTLTLSNAQNSYTGETIFGGGIINVASVSDYGVPSSIGARNTTDENNTVTGIGLHFRGGTLQYTGSTPQSTNREIRILNGVSGATIDASGSDPSATLSFTHTGANINLFDTPGTRTLNLTGANTGNNRFAIRLTDQAANATSLRKAGAGTWVIPNTDNTYTGETIFAGGILNVASLSDYGVVSSIGARTLAQENTTVTGVSLHFQGGTLQYTGTTPQSTNRNIRFLNGEGGTIDASGATPDATLSFTHTGANINLFDTPGIRTLTLTGTNTGNNTFSILMANQAGSATSLRKSGPGTWILSGPDTNSATGSTMVTQGTLVLGKTGATAVSGPLIIGDGTNAAVAVLGGTGGNQINDASVVTLFGAGATAGKLRMNNLNETVEGIESFDAGIIENESGAAGTSTLTVNVAPLGAHFFNGILRNGDGVGVDGTLALTKSGAGSLTLSGANTHTGATNVNGGTLTINGSLAGSAVTVNGATLDGTGTINGDVTIGNNGVVNMSNTGTIAGTVTINNGGRLSGTGTVNGIVNTTSGAKISPAAPNTAGTLVTAFLHLVSGALLDFEFGPLSDLLNVTTNGGLALNGGAFNLFDAGGVNPLSANGTYTLIDYASSYTGSINNLSVANSQVGKFYSIADDTANTRITLTVADTTITEWNGLGGNNRWSTTGNWTNGIPNAGGAVAKFGSLPTTPTTVAVDGPKTIGGILFDNANSYTISGGASDVITLNNGVAAASVTITTGNHTVDAPIVLATSANATTAVATTLTMNGNISGAASFIASGNGTTILTGTNSYGSTAINGGTLAVGNGGPTGTLGTGDITIAPAASLVFNRSNDVDVPNKIFGSAAEVAKLGAGTLTLSGVNSFATEAPAAFAINAGTVKLANGGALGNGVRLVFNGGSLDLNGNDVTAGFLDGPTGTILDTSAAPGTTALVVNQGADGTFAGSIRNGTARTVSLTKGGAAILTLTGNNTFAGPLTITNGTIIAAGDGTNVPIPGNVTLGDGTNEVWLIAGAPGPQFGASSVLNFNNAARNAKFQLRGSNQTVAGLDSTADPSFSLAIIQNDETTSPGYIGDPGPATLTINTTTDHSFAGLIRNQAGGGLHLVKEGAATQEIRNILVTTGNFQSVTVNNGKLVFNFAPNGNNTNTLAAGTSITVNQGGTFALDGNWTVPLAIAGIFGDGKIVKQGAGSVRIDSANTFTKGLTLDAGTLEIGNDLALGDPTGLITINGGNLRAAGQMRNVPNPVLVNGNFILGRLTNLNGGITLGADATIAANNPDGAANNPSSLSSITGNFRVTFAEGNFGVGTGAFMVDGQNTNSGGTAILAGRVNVNGALANAPLIVDGGELNLNNIEQSVTSLSGGGGTLNLSFGHTLTVNQPGETTFAGAIGNGGTLVKSGAGALTLTGASSLFFGAVTVNAGALRVNGTLNGSTSSVTVGGRLEGNGTVGMVALDGGTLSPGDAATTGIFSTGPLTLNSGTVEFTLNGATAGANYDQLNVAGTINLANNVQLVLSLGAPIVAGTSFTLFNNDDVEPVATTGLLAVGANALSEGETFAVNGQAFTISYAGGLDNNDVVLVALPEPSALGSLCAVAALWSGMRRRRVTRLS